MISRDNIDQLVGGKSNVLDAEGKKIGSIGQLYTDDRTETPSWVTVRTGLFGSAETFVPLDEATVDGDDIRVPYTKDQVKDAPRVETDGHLSYGEEDELYRHYGLSGGTTGTGTDTGYGTTTGTGDRGFGTPGREDYVGTGTDAADFRETDRSTDDAMTRSEERLEVGTERQATGRARLRKYIVTENVTQTVPVSHEEVRIEREPITDANAGDALSGPDLTEDEHEVILHEERPVVNKETVPVERVRLGKETVTDEETVTEQVRKEQIDTDGDDLRGR